MKKLLLLICVCMCTMLLACSQKTTPSDPQEIKMTTEEKVKQLALDTFKKDYNIQYNSSKTFASISKALKTRQNEVFPSLSILIYDVHHEDILHRETVARAKINWISDEELEVSTVPGMMGDGQQAKFGFIYNVSTKKKSPL